MFSLELLLLFVATLLAALYLHDKFRNRNFPKGKTNIICSEKMSLYKNNSLYRSDWAADYRLFATPWSNST